MTKKTKEELLATYKKASKPARLVIIGRAGFTSEEEYFKHLDSLVVPSLFKTKVEKEAEKGDGTLDQVIAFDTTGSMGPYIAAVRAHVKQLIPQLLSDNKNLKIKIVAFGDYCDMLNKDIFGAAYQESPLTDQANSLIDFVTHAKNTGGGDSDEFYELVIKKITEETPWRPGAKRSVLLIADYDPHPVGYSYHGKVSNSQIDWKIEAKKSADLGITWDTLAVIPSFTKTFYRPLSEMTGGVCMPFQSSHKTHDLVGATLSARGASAGSSGAETAYFSRSAVATKSGDKELIGTFKSLSSLLDD